MITFEYFKYIRIQTRCNVIKMIQFTSELIDENNLILMHRLKSLSIKTIR